MPLTLAEGYKEKTTVSTLIFSAVSQKSEDYLNQNKMSLNKRLCSASTSYVLKSNAALIGILLSLLP